MAINVTERIHINSNPEAIAGFMFNPLNDPSWISGIKEIRNISSSPIASGTEVHRIAHFLGKDVDYILKIDELKNNTSLSMESIKGPFPMKVRYEIEPGELKEPEDDEPYCIVRIQIKGESKGYFMFIDRLLSIMVSSNIRGDLQTLKSIMEDEEDTD